MSQKKKVTRTKDRADSEKRLLQAAKEVFSEHGFNGATTRMVAERAGINLALITRYFGNKYGLLTAVVMQEALNQRTSQLQYPPQKTLRDECLHFVEERFSSYMSQIDWFRIVIVQLITDRDFAKKIVKQDLLETRSNIVERITPFFRSGTTKAPQKEVRQLIETLEKSTLAAVIIQHLMAMEPKEKCLADLKSSVALYCQAFSELSNPRSDK